MYAGKSKNGCSVLVTWKHLTHIALLFDLIISFSWSPPSVVASNPISLSILIVQSILYFHFPFSSFLLRFQLTTIISICSVLFHHAAPFPSMWQQPVPRKAKAWSLSLSCVSETKCLTSIRLWGREAIEICPSHCRNLIGDYCTVISPFKMMATFQLVSQKLTIARSVDKWSDV